MSQKTQMVLGFFYLSHTLDLKARVDYCYDIKANLKLEKKWMNLCLTEKNILVKYPTN